MSDEKDKDEKFNTVAYGSCAISIIGAMDGPIARLGLSPNTLLAAVFTELMVHRNVSPDVIYNAVEMAIEQKEQIERVQELRRAFHKEMN